MVHRVHRLPFTNRFIPSSFTFTLRALLRVILLRRMISGISPVPS